MHLARRAPYTAVMVAAVVSACGGSSDAPASSDAATEAAATAWTPTAAEMERAGELGRGAATRLAGTLVQQLTARLEAEGPAGAIEFCSGRAMELTDSVNGGLEGLSVKRTSARVRNPDNAPDSLERAALARFETAAAGGALPVSWVQVAGEHELRYYQPLVVGEMCTQCHGPAAALDPAVRARLADRYPDDLAVGYAPGDFRGLIRVRIPRAALQQ